ncbi:placenta growth factor isoform X2 [Coturnix japonica]|uniref:placenta growth factor isoform X2 n=1 Tax=Coturnix japonica TaxID=93934 RepID=UPI000777E152|nr:placenta growth factor isoform X2 [Coturnix japonica]
MAPAPIRAWEPQQALSISVLLSDGLQSTQPFICSVCLSPQHLPARCQHLPRALSGTSTQGGLAGAWCPLAPELPPPVRPRVLGTELMGPGRATAVQGRTPHGGGPRAPAALLPPRKQRYEAGPGHGAHPYPRPAAHGDRVPRWHLLPPTSGSHSFSGHRGLKIARKRPRSFSGFNVGGGVWPGRPRPPARSRSAPIGPLPAGPAPTAPRLPVLRVSEGPRCRAEPGSLPSSSSWKAPEARGTAGAEASVLTFKEIWNRSFCRPREQLVDIITEFPNEVEYIFRPSCVSLQRCGGCCGDEGLRCVPVQTSTVTVQLVKIKPNGEAPYAEAPYVEMSFTEHKQCECRPRQDLARPGRRRLKGRGKRRQDKRRKDCELCGTPRR